MLTLNTLNYHILKGFKLFWDGTTMSYRKKPTLTARGEQVDAISVVLSQGQIIYLLLLGSMPDIGIGTIQPHGSDLGTKMKHELFPIG